MSTPARCTAFAYDISRVTARYYNECIWASTTALDVNAPGAATPVSFALLRDELTWGRYAGPQLPANLQSLLSGPNELTPPPDTPTETPSGPVIPSRAGGPPGGTPRGNGHDGDPVPNLRPIQRLRLLPGENTRGVLRNVTLPTINGCVLCKRFHLDLMCYTGCIRARYHVHPPVTVVDFVASALTAERAASTNA